MTRGAFFLLFALGVASTGSAAAQGVGHGDCAEATSRCSEQIEAVCLDPGRVGAAAISLEDFALGARCEGQLERYRACLKQTLGQCEPEDEAASKPGCSEQTAQQLFEAVADSGDPAEVSAFLEACPNAPQAPLARVRLRRLQGGSEIPPGPPPTTRFPLDRHIREAQQELRRLRYYDGEVDQDWGPGSREAMAAFQKVNRISPADGRLTEASLEALKAAKTSGGAGGVLGSGVVWGEK